MATYHPDRLSHLFLRPEFLEAAEVASDHELKHPQDGFVEMNQVLGEEVAAELQAAGVTDDELETIDINADWFEHHEWKFSECGRHVYDLTGRLDALQFPFDEAALVPPSAMPQISLYIHWGAVAGILSPHHGIAVEGCYIDYGRPRGHLEHYTFQFACQFADPRGREALPLAQEYRRYARGFMANFDVGDPFASELRALANIKDSWGPYRMPAIKAAVSALHFLMAGGFKKAEVGLSEPDDELIERLVDLRPGDEAKTQECQELMRERGVSLVHRCL